MTGAGSRKPGAWSAVAAGVVALVMASFALAASAAALFLVAADLVVF